jgi:hypothetical protein
MAKIIDPVRFSEHFGISGNLLEEAGVLNPTLNADTLLFIDPLLVPLSSHPEISGKARDVYVEHFGQVVRLLRATKYRGDVAWRSARRLMEFPEVKWTCLGYGANSVAGSGSGVFTTDSVMGTAKEIVDLGIEDPDLFVAMGLFEEGIGPDRISDMATNVIFPGLLDFNARVLPCLGVPTKRFSLVLRNGNSYTANLPVNPFGKKSQPIVLVPTDILRDLPIANDWSDVADAAARNVALRRQLNQDIGDIWRYRTLKDKNDLRRRVLSSPAAFETFLEMLHGADTKPYNLVSDPRGEIVWRHVLETIAAEQPLTLAAPRSLDAAGVAAVVEKIIEQFRFLIEDRRLSEELYHEGGPRPEKAAQRLFFAVAYAYCKANNLDITPEADTGNGPVDFKVSTGFTGRVLVEVKLSTNGKVVAGYSRQLETYKGAEETTHGFYVLLDVGGMGRKAKDLLALKNREATAGRPVSSIVIIDGKRRLSASKL